MKQRIVLFFCLLLLFLSFVKRSFAASDYVLPYPSTMPGSFMYKPHSILEEVLKYWYFGNFGQFTYNLKESDKYLVEAKTLFEYNQYLLGYNALKKSDEFFVKTLPFLEKAKKEGKDVNQNRETLSSAAQKHIEILKIIEKEVPESFNWQPEKSAASILDLKSIIESSILQREKFL
jgi:hypothetical protein